MKRSPIQRRTPLKSARYAFVVCPCCQLNPPDNSCHLCNGSGKVKAEYLRMAPGSGAKGNGTSIKRTPADQKFSLYIRERDNWTCQRCGKVHLPKSLGYHCAHNRGRNNRGLRRGFKEHTGLDCCVSHDPRNAVGLCWQPCHVLIDSDKWEKEKVFRNKFGHEVYELFMIETQRPEKSVPRLAP